MSKSIIQDVAYWQAPAKYVEKYVVNRAGRKYNKSRPYIYFWKVRWDGVVESLACRSRRPHSYPNQHTRPYTPCHNGKVERSHCEEQKRFYSCHSFFSLDDFAGQFAVHNLRSNNLPMRSLVGFFLFGSSSKMFNKSTGKSL